MPRIRKHRRKKAKHVVVEPADFDLDDYVLDDVTVIDEQIVRDLMFKETYKLAKGRKLRDYVV